MPKTSFRKNSGTIVFALLNLPGAVGIKFQAILVASGIIRRAGVPPRVQLGIPRYPLPPTVRLFRTFGLKSTDPRILPPKKLGAGKKIVLLLRRDGYQISTSILTGDSRLIPIEDGVDFTMLVAMAIGGIGDHGGSPPEKAFPCRNTDAPSAAAQSNRWYDSAFSI